jgi:4-hydroxy-tetrahydrodipicolinate synthase
MRNGGSGCISATANVNPVAIHNLYANWQSRDADDMQAALDDIRKVFQSYPMIPALKHCAAHYSADPEWSRVRPPLVALTERQQTGLVSDLKRINFGMPGLVRAAD